jgi:hypothetical protein
MCIGYCYSYGGYRKDERLQRLKNVNWQAYER